MSFQQNIVYMFYVKIVIITSVYLYISMIYIRWLYEPIV